MSRLRLVLRRTGIGCVLAIWFSNSTVAADPIRFDSFRIVEGRGAAETAEGTFETAAFEDFSLLGLFNMGVSGSTPPEGWSVPPGTASFGAAQHTDVSAAGWFGSGTASTEAISFSTAQAESIMLIQFTLAQPMSYRFAGTITGEGGSTVIRLDGPGELGWILESGNAVPLVAMHRGLLSPGDYVFNARAYSESNVGGRRTGTSAFDVQFTLTNPVPEPATLLLFATGGAYVGRAAWKRRRRESATGSSDPIRDT